jgi:hypothetical protein
MCRPDALASDRRQKSAAAQDRGSGITRGQNHWTQIASTSNQKI